MSIEVKNVSKKFKETLALDNISMCFESGKIHGIIGRNGSGKSVLMKCICGFMKPTTGEIMINGSIVKQSKPQDIGIIIETPGFLDNKSGYKNLLYLASINKKIDSEKVKLTLSTVGLDANSKKHVGKYSLGMRQRLGIAQAIMEDPNILILDEPMNGLDNQGVLEMRELFLKLKSEGKTILLASHNKEDIAVLCDTVIELDHGVVISENS